MFENINLKKELIKGRKIESSLDIYIDDIYAQIYEENQAEESITDNLIKSKYPLKNINLNILDTDCIFDIKEIKKIAIKYRLRLLPTKFFNNKVPKEAVLKIKHLNRKNNENIKEFIILAPSKAFNLEDENADPLLFIRLSASKYYLVHQWGNDLSWYNKLSSLPLRNFASIVISVGIIAAIVALLTPTWIILNSAEIDMGYWGYHRLAWFFYSYILLASMTTLICFSQNIYPSDYQWNRKTFN